MKFKNLKTNTFINAIGSLSKELLKDKDYRLAVDSDFKESDHPRASNGQFGSGGGSASSSSSSSSTGGGTLTQRVGSVRSKIKELGIKAKVKVAPGGGNLQVVTPTYEGKFSESELKNILETAKEAGFTMVRGGEIDPERQSKLVGQQQWDFYPRSKWHFLRF